MRTTRLLRVRVLILACSLLVAARALLRATPALAADAGLQFTAWYSVLAVVEARPAPRNAAGATIRARLSETYGKLPLHFEDNRGQTDPRVKFLARGGDYTLFLTSTDAVLLLTSPDPQGPGEGPGLKTQPDRRPRTRATLRMTVVGANPAPCVTGQEELPGKVNYFIGNDPAKWRTNVPTYALVHYQEIYPGIDLTNYGNQLQLEYDFVVSPGSDPGRIRLGLQGADRLEVDATGDLVLYTAAGPMRQR